MTTSTKTARGLDAHAPEKGAARDCYEVAATATMLCARTTPLTDRDARDPIRHAARHATTLHIISGRLHRIAEHQCNGDAGYACPACGGDGYIEPMDDPKMTCAVPCPKCKGSGIPASELRLRADAEAIAAHYNLRAYFQTDPRGCALYLLAPDVPKDDYTRGHAVTRIGR